VIPRHSRHAEALQTAIKQAWNVDALLLDLLLDRDGGSSCAILEIVSQTPDDPFCAATLSEIDDADLAAQERSAVKKTIEGNGDLRVFSRCGWLQEAIGWLKGREPGLDAWPVHVRQLNGGRGFVLLSCEFGNRRVFWLKATGNPNENELAITRALAEISPNSLPRIVAIHSESNAWWMEDSGACACDVTLAQLMLTAFSLAELQLKTVHESHRLLTVGAADQRLPVLRGKLNEVMEYVANAMLRQASTRVPALSADQLARLSDSLHDALSNLMECEFPDAVLHGDLNAGNVLFQDAHCVFTDWSEAAVGNPLINFHHLCRLNAEADRQNMPIVQNAYLAGWNGALDAEQLDRVSHLIPLVAAYSSLYGRGTWLVSPKRHAPAFESFARSMARHMYRALPGSQAMEVLCR
jgi:hypothetical protein